MRQKEAHMLAARSIRPAIFIALAAPLALAGCGDKGRKAEAETPTSHAEVSTRLPASDVSDEFLKATAQVAADAVAIPHTEEVVVTPAPAPSVAIPPVGAVPPADNGAAGNAAANMQGAVPPEGANAR
jgi:hypothetical protein